MLSKKSPRRNCRIEMRTNRIICVEPLNQCCVPEPDLKSILLGGARNFFFRQHRVGADFWPRCADEAESKRHAYGQRCGSVSPTWGPDGIQGLVTLAEQPFMDPTGNVRVHVMDRSTRGACTCVPPYLASQQLS